jgi:linoleoyl-CoA desaturase
MLLWAALDRPSWPWLLLLAIPLGVTLSTATLTVLHDAGHRRLSRRTWPNVLAVQTAAPVGLWVGHWTLKHRVHHRVTQVYPLDDATRSSGIVRLHPGAPLWRVHRYQHVYAWAMYTLAWLGELRSQVTFVRTGVIAGIDAPPFVRRLGSFVLEKGLCVLFLAPYGVLLGVGHLALLLVAAMTVGSICAAVINVVGHINVGLVPTSTAPRGSEWSAHIVRTTASFSLESRAMRWLTGGLTHHLAHHLRPIAPRADLPTLHNTLVMDIAKTAGVPVTVYPNLSTAVRGHLRTLRVLGEPAPEPLRTAAADVPLTVPPPAWSRARRVSRPRTLVRRDVLREPGS